MIDKKYIAVAPETHEKLQVMKDALRPEGIRTIGGVVDALVSNAYEREVDDGEEGK